jgi:hypothetical protein
MTLKEVNEILRNYGKVKPPVVQKKPSVAQKRKNFRPLGLVSLVQPKRQLKPNQKIITIVRPFSNKTA